MRKILCAAAAVIMFLPTVSAAEPRRLNAAEEDALIRFCASAAEGEGLLAQLSLAAVMLNRCADGRFPDRLSTVLEGAGCRRSSIGEKDRETAAFAVRLAAMGVDPTGGAVYWRRTENGMEFFG